MSKQQSPPRGDRLRSPAATFPRHRPTPAAAAGPLVPAATTKRKAPCMCFLVLFDTAAARTPRQNKTVLTYPEQFTEPRRRTPST